MNVATFDSIVLTIMLGLSALAFIVLAAAAVRWLRAHYRLSSRRYRELQDLASVQATALDAVVSEIASNEAYKAFPEELWKQLLTAHDKSRKVIAA